MDHFSTQDLGCLWPSPAAVPTLAADELHVWCAAVDVSEDLAEELLGTLADDERQRAARYLSDPHRRRFIACRAAQRMILATYTGASAQEIEFVYSPLGKPALAASGSAAGLEFNVSNSGDMALFAMARNRQLGVDVERIRDNLDHDGLSQRFFAAGERDKLRHLPEELRLQGFFDCWTRKEAFLKAIGKGLTYPLDRAVVAIGPQEPCRLLSLDGDETAAAAWSLLALHPAPGYTAAIAATGGEPKTQAFFWRWS